MGQSSSEVAVLRPGLLLWLCLLSLVGCLAPAREGGDAWATIPYSGTFEFRYEPSPRDAAPTLDPTPKLPPDDGGFRPMLGLGKQPGRDGAQVLWLRTRLVGPALARPTLSLRLAALSVQAYLDGQPLGLSSPIYGLLNTRAHLRGEYLLSLPPDYAGRTLLLRLQTSAPPIGLELPASLGEASGVTMALVRRNADFVLVALLLFVLSGLGAAVWVLRRDEPVYRHFSLACLGFAVSLIGFCGVTGVLFAWPLPALPCFMIGNLVGSLGMCSFVRVLLDDGPFRVLLWMHWLLLALCAVLSLSLIFRPEYLLVMNRPWSALATLFFGGLTATAIRGLRRGDVDAKLLSLGMVATLLVALPETLGAVGIRRGYTGQHYTPTILTFILTLVVILLRRFIATHNRSLRLQIEHGLAQQRLLEQEALLLASARMAAGDFEQPISVEAQGALRPLAMALDGMRQDIASKLVLLESVQQDLRQKLTMLEARNQEVGKLNDELRRQIEGRSKRLFDALLPAIQSQRPARELGDGDRLGEHYRIIRNIGQGGMGVVYEVSRATDERRLAAKVLRRGVVDNTRLRRFAREAQIMARLHHPNLVAIVDVDVTDDGTLYLVMELVSGPSLSALRERFSDLRWDCAVLAQVAAALSALHSRGIIHRDIKPENVLLTDAGPQPQVKLVDFGISRLLDDTSPDALPPSTGTDAELLLPAPSAPVRTLTQTGVVMGTPGYLAPELLRGARHALPASDIFSLGVLASELFSGQRPSAPSLLAGAGDGLAEMRLRLRACRALPSALLAILERAVASDPEIRPSADELTAALRSGEAEIAASLSVK